MQQAHEPVKTVRLQSATSDLEPKTLDMLASIINVGIQRHAARGAPDTGCEFQLNNLFQFWDTDHAPEEVERLMSSWADHPHFTYRRYNYRTAAEYIDEHFDTRTLRAYEECAVPAMQSDFFRYCALVQEGGTYIDAGLRDNGGIEKHLCHANRGVLWRRRGNVANGFIFARNPRDPLLTRALDKAIENIENKTSNNVWQVTGPGIMTEDFWNSEINHIFDGFDLITEEDANEIFFRPGHLSYKKSSTDWRAFLKEGAPSIFENRYQKNPRRKA